MSSATVSTTGTPAVIPFISKSRPVTTIVGGATMLSIAMTSADIRRPTQLSGRSQCSSPPTGENTRIRLSRVRHRPLSVPRLSAARWGRKEIFGWRCKWMLNLLRLRRDSQRDIHTSYIRPEFSYTYIHTSSSQKPVPTEESSCCGPVRRRRSLGGASRARLARRRRARARARRARAATPA
jgi:hypothetical protein